MMKFYNFQKRLSETGEWQMLWFTSKAEAEKKLREEVKNNPYYEYMRDVEYELSSSVDCCNIPTDKKGLLRFLQRNVNFDQSQWYPWKSDND